MTAGRTGSPALDPGRERAIVLLLTIAAFVLRIWALDRAGLGQYDEGVYALSALGVTDPDQPYRLWQSQERFSPPVHFLLVALSYLVGGGPSDTAAVMVSVLLGTLLVPVAWWSGRSFFGPASGVVAAAFTALSEFHVVLARSGLTDVAFTVFFVIALTLLVAAMEQGGFTKAVLAGVATGVAWNTKYHGWFVLLIGAGAWLAWSWFGTASGKDRRRAAVAWLTSSVVAVACYLPWALFIQSRSGGTAEWSRYYSTMLGRDWFGHFATHVANQFTLEGPWTMASLPLAVTLLLVTRGTARAWRWPELLAGVAAAGFVALLIGGAGGMMLLGVGGVAVLLLGRDDRGRLATWIALGWAGLWFVAAPIYRPYFRLLLPFEVVAAILAGVALERWFRASTTSAVRAHAGLVAASLAVVAGVFVAGLKRSDTTDPWRESADMRTAVAAMEESIPPGAQVRVIWEPPVAFYLQAAGRQAFEDVEDITVLDTMSVERYIVTGIYVRRTPLLREGMARHADELELMGRYPVRPTEIRILDDLSWERAREYRARPDSTFDLLLYRYRPRAATR